jgi:hypothetical protein
VQFAKARIELPVTPRGHASMITDLVGAVRRR